MSEVEGQPAVAVKHCDKLFSLARNCLDRAEALTTIGRALPEFDRVESSSPNDSSEAISQRSQTSGSSSSTSAPTTPVAGKKQAAVGKPTPSSLEEAVPAEEPEDGSFFVVLAQRKNKAMYQHYKSKLEKLDERARSEMVRAPSLIFLYRLPF